MIKWLWCIGVILTGINSFAQQPFTKQIWVGDVDIPVNVHDVAYQKNGYLWLATDEGLMYYNGRNFSKINDSLNRSCLHVAVFRQEVFAAFANGLIAKLNAPAMTLQPVCPQLITGITCIAPAKGNNILIGTKDSGVFLLMKDKVLPLNKMASFRLTDNFVNDIKIIQDKVFVATDKGVNIFSYSNKKWNHHNVLKKHGLPDNIVTCIASGQKDTLCWVGTQQSGVVLYHPVKKQILPQSVQREWRYGQINDILPVGLRKAWAVTEQGYLLAFEHHKGIITTKAYSLNVKLKKLVKDKAGNIWCATHTGLLMHTGLYLTNLPLPPSYRLADITAITTDHSGHLWFSQKEKLFRLSITPPSKPVFIEALPTAITTLYHAPENILWIGSFGAGLFNYDHKKLQKLHIPALDKGHIISISQAFHKLWIASLNGLFALPIDILSAGNLKTYTKKDGVGSAYIYQLSTDAQGGLWMATDGGGITQYNGTGFIKWDKVAGQKTNVFYSIHAATENKVWANSLDNGLYRFDGKSWKNYNTAHGLQDLAIHAIAPHGKDGLIVVNKKGIDQWSEKAKQFRQYNRKLELGIDSISQVLNCIATDKEGNVYVPYNKGFLRFEQQASENIQPDIQIKKMSLFFKNIPLGKHEFAHDENHLSFAFEGIHFTQPEPPQYRYKLMGYDNNWVYTENETISFAQLNPGKYTFTVQASLSNNFINPSESQYSFIIKKPFWQTAWFIVLCAIVISAVLYVFIKWRERNIIRANRMQKQRMVYEYEHLKTQVNPHFLFNSFNTLANIIEEDKEAAIHYTERLSDLYRNMLSYKDVDLISLKEEYEILQSYLHIQKSRFGEALKIHETINPLYLKTKKIVPLSLQILLENAIKHNIVSLTHPLDIYITTEENTISICNNLQPKMSREKGQGIGLENIYKRYQLLTNRTLFYGIKNNQYLVILPLI